MLLGTIDVIRLIFSKYGLANQIVSDNGPQFRSFEFQQFCKLNGIKHTLIPPYHPASNGAAENTVKSVKNALIKAFGDKQNSKVSTSCLIARYLLNYRSSVHSTTKRTPASMMFGRELRIRLDNVRPKCKQMTVELDPAKQGRKEIFEVGDDVYIRDYRNNNKRSWTRAKIHKVLGLRVYLCKILDSQMVWKRHVDQIYRTIPSSISNELRNTSDKFVYAGRYIHSDDKAPEVSAVLANANTELTSVHVRPIRNKKKPVKLDL